MTEVLNTIDLSVFCVLVVLFLAVSRPGKASNNPLRSRLFLIVILSIALMLILDAICNLLGSSSLRALHIAATTLYYACHPIPLLAFIVYIDYTVFGRREHLQAAVLAVSVFWAVTLLIALANLLWPLVFTIDARNSYHRAPFFNYNLVVLYLPVLASMLFVLKTKKRLDRREFLPLILFPVPGIIGSLIQLFFTGTSLVWTGATLSALLLYIHIQNRQLTEDYLTGAYNRRCLDDYLKVKTRHANGGSGFSALMMDLDNFKRINDQYGHATGDAALIAAVHVLHLALRNMDFIARYAGDEFVVVLPSADQKSIDEIILRIEQEVDAFNTSGCQYYSLGFSIGSGIYDPGKDADADHFLNRIDAAMYLVKKHKKMPGYENGR